MKKFYCPECGKEMTYKSETECYHCECGYFEDWGVVEGKYELSIGTPLEKILRNQETSY